MTNLYLPEHRSSPDAPLVRCGAIVYQGATLGLRVHVGHFAVVRDPNVLGDDVSIGCHCVLEPHNVIGARTRIHSACTMEHATIGEDVFVGPGCRFTDDRFPHGQCGPWLECAGGVHVGDGAIIGGGSVLLPGVRIGARALVQAGSVVGCDVPDEHVFAQGRIVHRSKLFCVVHERHPYRSTP